MESKSVYYVGKVLGSDGADFNVNFLRRSTADKFHEPDVAEEALVLKSDIKMILTHVIRKATKRQKAFVTFQVKLSSLDIRNKKMCFICVSHSTSDRVSVFLPLRNSETLCIVPENLAASAILNTESLKSCQLRYLKALVTQLFLISSRVDL